MVTNSWDTDRDQMSRHGFLTAGHFQRVDQNDKRTQHTSSWRITSKVQGLGIFQQPIWTEPKAKGSKGEEHELKCQGQSGARLHQGPRGQVKNLKPCAEIIETIIHLSTC